MFFKNLTLTIKLLLHHLRSSLTENLLNVSGYCQRRSDMEQKSVIETIVNHPQTTTETDVYQSRWGWHPYSQETFLKLKALHKRVWEAWKKHSRLKSWSRKTVHYSPEPPPLDEYFSYELELRDSYSAFQHYRKTKDGDYEEYHVKAVFYHPDKPIMYHFEPIASEIVESMREGKTPMKTPEDVKEPALTEQRINELYEEVFEQN